MGAEGISKSFKGSVKKCNPIKKKIYGDLFAARVQPRETMELVHFTRNWTGFG